MVDNGERAAVFDLYDTLVRIDPEARLRHQSQLAKVLGLTLDRFLERWSATSHDSNRGLLATTAARFAAVAPAGEKLGRQLAAAEHQFLRENTIVADGADHLLRGFRKQGVRTGLVSNCSRSATNTLDVCGLLPLLDVVVLSWQVGHVKPEHEIFGAALTQLGVHAAETVYIADGRDHELEAATALGMRAVQVTWSNPDGTLPAGVPSVHGMNDIIDIIH